MNPPIYLDYNGTTPMDSEVIAEMWPFVEIEFGNPSSGHWFGIAPKRAVASARARIAAMINCKPQEIIFTSGGTESNNHAIRGVAQTHSAKGNHIITSVIEHPAVLEVCRHMETVGFRTTYIPVNEKGIVNPLDVKEAIEPDTILITIMSANNEVGSIQPIAEIAEIAKERNILVHTDAAQSCGKSFIDVAQLNIDLLSIAGHKLYAPKGIGALYIRQGTNIGKFMFGAGQESDRRAGTENVTQIIGLGKACEVAKIKFDANVNHMKHTRDRLKELLFAGVDDIAINGDSDNVLPNTLSLSFKGLEANRILEEIGLEVAASAGAACHSDLIHISHVLKAMNVPLEWAKGAVRFSTGKYTTEEEILRAAEVTINAVKRLRFQPRQ